ncbi:nucleoside-diphosphate kinase [Kitasatospora sp. NPDC049285]|uniref:nucleoside-diphosphate kinase n=1 Tax=Kitasatospora sp. NPDC049285 TaxID=3157096 RepID=UPI00343C1301
MADQVQTVERTLVLLKPDALVRGFAGKIIARFEDAALKIVGTKMKWLDDEFTRKHYFDLEERLGADVYNLTATFMQQGPVMALVLEGYDAIATVRKIVGSTYPNQAPAGTIRGDYSHMSSGASLTVGKAVANLVHASGNKEEAEQEVELWFAKDELFEYKTLAESYIY